MGSYSLHSKVYDGPMGYKKRDVTKVVRNYSGSSAHVRGGGEKEEKEQQASNSLNSFKDILETRCGIQGFPVIYHK